MNQAHCAQPGYLPPVTISLEPGTSYFVVTQGDRQADGMGWDEMIGQVIALTHPRIRMPHYPMRTAAERRLEWARRQVRQAEADIEKERAATPDELSCVTDGAL